MKKAILLLVMLSTGLPACKYDDGPFLTVYTKLERVAGFFFFDRVVENGANLTEEYADQNIQFHKNDQRTFAWELFPLDPENPTQTDNMRFGTWAFEDNEQFIRMKIFSPDADSIQHDWRWEIKRLSYKDLWLERQDENGQTVAWRLWKWY